MNKRKIAATVLSLSALLIWGGGCANEHDKFVAVPDIKNGESIRSRSSYVLGLPEAGSNVGLGDGVTSKPCHWMFFKVNVPFWRM